MSKSNGTANGSGPAEVDWDDSRHEWVSFDDGDGDTWMFDLTFLASSWTCIFGQGCLGVHETATPELGHGCCSFGSHLQDADDLARVRKAVKRLTRESWQFHDRAKKLNGPIYKNRAGETVTRVVDGACIFLNRDGFPTGVGCALHSAALAAGERPMDWKPGVCWQLPLRLESADDDHGRTTYTLREWKRRDWGGGGESFHWWCTDDPLAFRDRATVYETMRDELIELIGADAYDWLGKFFAERPPEVWLPHPVLRKRSAAPLG